MRLLALALAAFLAPGLVSGLSTWGRVPQEKEINFYNDGPTYYHGNAYCITRKSDSVPIANFGLQDLVQFKRMIDCEEHGAIHSWQLKKDGDASIRFSFQCCRPRADDPALVEWKPDKARTEERVSEKLSEGNRNWRNHNYVLVGYDSNSQDDRKDRVKLQCGNDIKALMSFKYEHFYVSGDEDQWRWNGKCIEMDTYNERWLSTPYQQSMENGETFHQYSCDTFGQCNDVDWLGRLEVECKGLDEVMTSFVFRPVDGNYYVRTKENGATSKAYFFKVVYSCAQIGRPPPKPASRYAFLRPASTEDCIGRAGNAWMLQPGCSGTQDSKFFVQIVESNSEFDDVRLVHAATGKCLIMGAGVNNVVMQPGMDDCSSQLARIKYTRAKTLDIQGYVLSANSSVLDAPALAWVRGGSLEDRIVIDSILDGEAIANYASACSDAAKRAYGWTGEGCPLEQVTGVGNPTQPPRLKVPVPFKAGVAEKLTFYWKNGDFKAGLAGVSMQVKGAKAAQEIIAPLPFDQLCLLEVSLPAPGTILDLWILTNREDEDVVGIFDKLKVLGVKIKDAAGKVVVIPEGSADALPWDQAIKVPIGEGALVGVAAAVSGTSLSSLGFVPLGGLDTIVSLPKFNFDAVKSMLSASMAPKVAALQSLTNPGDDYATFTATLTYSHTDSVAITNALTTTDTVGQTVAWANSFKTGVSFKVNFDVGVPILKVGSRSELTTSLEYSFTRTSTESTQRAVANTLSDVKTKIEATGLNVACSTRVPPRSQVEVSALFFAGKASIKYTGELVYVLKTGANFSYPISGTFEQVTQTNVVCRVGKEVPIGGNSKAAVSSEVAAAGSTPAYKYTQPVTVFVKGSPCGAQYTIRRADVGAPVDRIAYRCKVPKACLLRANLQFFASPLNLEYSHTYPTTLRKPALGKKLNISC
ncbi:hypothetical protein ABPG75_012707 [Micractinium tetrahymenae]